jgi:hypothetical protein
MTAPVLRRSISVMGTGATVELHEPLSLRDAERLAEGVFAWLHAVDHGFSTFRAGSWVLSGTDLAVATSGTYERDPHVVNPRTGRPESALRSVTVVGRDLADADAYATAALAMGRAGLAWLARLAGHQAAVVAEDGTWYRSGNLPEAGCGPRGRRLERFLSIRQGGLSGPAGTVVFVHSRHTRSTHAQQAVENPDRGRSHARRNHDRRLGRRWGGPGREQQ